MITFKNTTSAEENRCIAYQDGHPSGYIQSYKVDQDHEYGPYRHSEGETQGIALFIEDADFLKLGLQMLEQLIGSFENKVQRVIVNPVKAGIEVVSLFSQYGFKTIEPGNRFLMSIDIRRAVRAVLVNERLEILMMRLKADPSKSEQKGLVQFWITPGGKIEISESIEEALRREIREEVGFTDIFIGDELFCEEKSQVWDKTALRHFNRYYLVRTKEETVTSEHLMEDEKKVVLGYKWWTLGELLQTNEVIYPKNFGNRMKEWVSHEGRLSTVR